MSNRDYCIKYFNDNLREYVNPNLKPSQKHKILSRVRKGALQKLYVRITGKEVNPRWTKEYIVERLASEV